MSDSWQDTCLGYADRAFKVHRAAFKRGVLHRDVSPGNVYIDPLHVHIAGCVDLQGVKIPELYCVPASESPLFIGRILDRSQFHSTSICYMPNIHPCRSSPAACSMLGDFHLSAKYPAESASEKEKLQLRTVSDQRDLSVVCTESCLLGNRSLHRPCSSERQVPIHE